MGIDPIFRLHLMAEQRPIGTMGLIFSASGYTDPAIELAERLRPIRVLVFSTMPDIGPSPPGRREYDGPGPAEVGLPPSDRTGQARSVNLAEFSDPLG